MTDDTTMLSGRVPEELKRLVDADERANQDVIAAALYTEFGGLREGALERRVAEQENRVEMIETEIEDRKEELEEEREELERLREKLESVREKQEEYEDQLSDVADLLPAPADRTPDNPAVKTQANRLGVEPDELLDDLAERDL